MQLRSSFFFGSSLISLISLMACSDGSSDESNDASDGVVADDAAGDMGSGATNTAGGAGQTGGAGTNGGMGTSSSGNPTGPTGSDASNTANGAGQSTSNGGSTTAPTGSGAGGGGSTDPGAGDGTSTNDDSADDGANDDAATADDASDGAGGMANTDDSATATDDSTDDSATDDSTDDGSSEAGQCDGAAALGTNRVCIKGKAYYLNGINVAWDQWDNDLANYNASSFEAMFSELQAAGGNSVRWWWFPTGDEQLSYSGDMAQPLSQNIFDNLDQAFDAAAERGILIMPVLLSFDIESGNRQALVTNPDATDAFVANVVTPLVERYNDHPGLGLWEIMNEGDWLLSEEQGNISTADYQRFHAKVAAGIHAADADALVTTGSASFKYLENGNNILSDAALQQAADGDALAYLDVYQTHYYPWMHGDGWSYEPWIRTADEWQSDGKPILIGEFPCRGEEGRWSTMDMHIESVNQGYAGTFCWAYFDNRADDEGTWADARPAVEAIAAQIPTAITGE